MKVKIQDFEIKLIAKSIDINIVNTYENDFEICYTLLSENNSVLEVGNRKIPMEYISLFKPEKTIEQINECLSLFNIVGIEKISNNQEELYQEKLMQEKLNKENNKS